jgi:hypothetical protein
MASQGDLAILTLHDPPNLPKSRRVDRQKHRLKVPGSLVHRGLVRARAFDSRRCGWAVDINCGRALRRQNYTLGVDLVTDSGTKSADHAVAGTDSTLTSSFGSRHPPQSGIVGQLPIGSSRLDFQSQGTARRGLKRKTGPSAALSIPLHRPPLLYAQRCRYEKRNPIATLTLI